MSVDTDAGLSPAGGFVSVIVIDSEADDTNCGLRAPADVPEGTTITNCDVTRLLCVGVVGALVGVMIGDVPPPPPPAHAATDAAAISATAEEKIRFPSRFTEMLIRESRIWLACLARTKKAPGKEFLEGPIYQCPRPVPSPARGSRAGFVRT